MQGEAPIGIVIRVRAVTWRGPAVKIQWTLVDRVLAFEGAGVERRSVLAADWGNSDYVLLSARCRPCGAALEMKPQLVVAQQSIVGDFHQQSGDAAL
jgi:hypothetical protein